ncbi:hypothetical protein ACWD25_53830, partial [Streptomyces sp. NPDC002920]
FDTYKESPKDSKGKNGKAPLAEAALLGGKPRGRVHRSSTWLHGPRHSAARAVGRRRGPAPLRRPTSYEDF